MKIKIVKEIEADVKYIQAECGVRYWEDATVNGTEDSYGDLIPLRDGDCWKPTIEIETGIILDWPKGAEASIHYKVCDDGVYRLLDEEKKTVVEIDGYVPDIMSPKENGYGDYVIMDVCTNGKIQNWKPSFDEFTRRAEG
jgi:hypothetical protein